MEGSGGSYYYEALSSLVRIQESLGILLSLSELPPTSGSKYTWLWQDFWFWKLGCITNEKGGMQSRVDQPSQDRGVVLGHSASPRSLSESLAPWYNPWFLLYTESLL